MDNKEFSKELAPCSWYSIFEERIKWNIEN